MLDLRKGVRELNSRRPLSDPKSCTRSPTRTFTFTAPNFLCIGARTVNMNKPSCDLSCSSKHQETPFNTKAQEHPLNFQFSEGKQTLIYAARRLHEHSTFPFHQLPQFFDARSSSLRIHIIILHDALMSHTNQKLPHPGMSTPEPVCAAALRNARSL